jgi:serine/threonine protein kinase
MDDLIWNRCCLNIYASPEVISNNVKYNGKCSDIWSLGIILYFLLTKKYPFMHKNIKVLFKLITKGDFSLDGLNSKYSNLLKDMLNINPLDRPKIDQIIKLFV